MGTKLTTEEIVLLIIVVALLLNELRSARFRQSIQSVLYLPHFLGWVVISAIYSDHHPGFTEVVATRGGRRDPAAEERRFLVPAAEYRVGPFGFVIDEARHAVYDGPSSFIGWRGRAGG